MRNISEYYYVYSDSIKLFTCVCLPERGGRFPSIVIRSPYVDSAEALSEEEVCESLLAAHKNYIDSGYAVVYQHCRGRGKSGGDCVPYIYEREDTLALYDWIRGQSFYNGELYLVGKSYLSSVHFMAAPWADDVRGAILEAQDCERYNCNYRNGFYKMGLHGGWYFKMYKKKTLPNKNFVNESYNLLPLIGLSEAVMGESSESFDEILRHPDRNDTFWSTRYGGGEAHEAIKHAGIPILLVTGFYDIYTGGVFDMWRGLDDKTRALSALLVHPYDHSQSSENKPIVFENGTLPEAFGDYKLKWLNHIRGYESSFVRKGEITYYSLFENKWHTDSFEQPTNEMKFSIGEGERSYLYNPYAPAHFKGGSSSNFSGAAFQDKPNSRYDILSFYTPLFEEDKFVKGKMRARLRVKSDCEDTCFYIRISLVSEGGDYVLRDDINQISNFCPDYRPGEELDMFFSFDDHAFVVHKGEKLRIDISSSAFPLYVRHTNMKGLFSEQTTAKIAHNTVVCDRSYLIVPYE